MGNTRYTAIVQCEDCDRLQAACIEKASKHVSTGGAGCPDCGSHQFYEISPEQLGL